MSSSRPPLQGIPVRKLPEYREFFIPKYDIIFAPDISQQEPRILAYLSQDANLLQCVRANESVHVYVARMIYNDPTIQKGEDSRYKDGKAISLGLSYGLTAKGTAKKTGHTEAEAEKLVHTYFQRFPDVENYIVRQRTKAMQREYVETVAGRRVWLNMYGYQWQNNAINAPIQGSAADFTKIWGATIWRKCKAEGIPFPIVMFIHDEIMMDVMKQYFQRIKEINLEAIDIAGKMFKDIPFTCDENTGDTWACHK
jgi:DNA polymerase-1